jgi:hypothetical protein
LEIDDRFGACETLRQAGIVALGGSKFGGQRIRLNALAAALARDQGGEGASVALPAPVGQRR